MYVMNKFFGAAIIALLVLVPRAWAEGPDDQYVEIYTQIQDGDNLAAEQPVQALAKYRGAQSALQKFQKGYPDWNSRIVDFRLNYLASKITDLSARIAAATASVPAAAAPPNAPAPQSAKVQPAVQPVAVNPLQTQVSSLQEQIRQLQTDKSLLQAKLKEALSAQPTPPPPTTVVDTQELARATARIRTLQKENDLLKVSLARKPVPQAAPKIVAPDNATLLDQAKKDLAAANRRLAAETERADTLAREKQDLTNQLSFFASATSSRSQQAKEAVNKALEDANRKLAAQEKKIGQLNSDNAALQVRMKQLSADAEAATALRSENELLRRLASSASSSPTPAANSDRDLAAARARIAALESDQEVWRLEKAALENRLRQASAPAAAPAVPEDSARMKQVEAERDELQKKLDAAQKELYGRNSKAAVAKVDELMSQLEVLRARLEVFESRQVPYSPEELALFKNPNAVLPVTDPRQGMKSVKELPSGTTQLIAEAQRDFSARRLDDAEQKYLEVLRRDDRNVNTLANLATIQMEMGHLDEAEKHIQAALAVAPNDAYSLSILGNLRYRQGNYDEALNALSRAAKADPQNAEIQNFLGLTLSQKGLRVAAETALRKAVQLQPEYGSAHYNLAVVYLTQQPPMVELARWHYEKSLAAGFPANRDLEKMLAEKKTAEAGR